jgi:hypothetical protein
MQTSYTGSTLATIQLRFLALKYGSSGVAKIGYLIIDRGNFAEMAAFEIENIEFTEDTLEVTRDLTSIDVILVPFIRYVNLRGLPGNTLYSYKLTQTEITNTNYTYSL